MDLSDQLEMLERHRESGTLSVGQFEAEKARLLATLRDDGGPTERVTGPWARKQFLVIAASISALVVGGFVVSQAVTDESCEDVAGGWADRYQRALTPAASADVRQQASFDVGDSFIRAAALDVIDYVGRASDHVSPNTIRVEARRACRA